MNKKNNTLEAKIVRRMARKKSAVLLRKDFADLGNYDQVGVVLKKLVNQGTLLKLGYGLYAKTEISPYTGKIVPQLGLPELAREALKRLGIKTYPSKLLKDYNAGKSTQVPTGRVIGVKERISRKIGYNGVYVYFEHAT